MSEENDEIRLPDKAHEFEISRRLARFFIHYAAMVLTDATWCVPIKQRYTVTEIVGGLNTLEARLGELAPRPE